jgi:hypothetical protein
MEEIYRPPLRSEKFFENVENISRKSTKYLR